jgi:hypothetical protein
MKPHLLGIAALIAVTLAAPRIAVGQGLASGYGFVSPVLGFAGVPVALGSGGGVDQQLGEATGIGGKIENLYLPAFSTRR